MKRLLIILIMLFGIISLQAQENRFLKKVHYFLTKPDDVDSTRIYQPNKACFAVGPFFSVQRAGFDVDVNFSVNSNEMNQSLAFRDSASVKPLARKLALRWTMAISGSVTAMKLGLQAPQQRGL